ncbi:pyridoxamine 5'-phosphate oxidase [Zalerion maritima]|uniref:pyridoxal 5'-phosphate synthase n=1 Tax=Zalerion maritima TaxID=339359 RepID=A0AAD5RZA9_9PEZI|nr:pyridoxamine 5'-phosphate oxidase [Zalerion maritima]
MALHPPQAQDKLIFAAAGSTMNTQAEQFTANTPLHRSDLDQESPVAQYHSWFTAAQKSGQVAHPETCCMSTASLPSGRVSSRIVYMKELDSSGGFVAYSNFGTSRKADDLKRNPYVSLTFWWEAMQRQIRVEGKAERLSAEESQKYFEMRARGSRVGAWASRQSWVLEPKEGENNEEGKEDDGRMQLEEWVKEAKEKFEGKEDIPVPPFWGGLRVVPDRMEFWQGRDSRLHDRFVYELQEETGKWKLERLSPRDGTLTSCKRHQSVTLIILAREDVDGWRLSAESSDPG